MSKEIFVRKTVLTMAVLAFASIMSTQASAAPLSGAAAATQPVNQVVDVQYRDRDRDGVNDRRELRRNDWRRDRRYYRYRSWNRYNSRPYNYRSRGCVSLGGIWLCR